LEREKRERGGNLERRGGKGEKREVDTSLLADGLGSIPSQPSPGYRLVKGEKPP